MPLQPPGNRLFRTYYDGNGRLQSQFIGPDPIKCASCGRETYRTASGNCAWCKGTLVASSLRYPVAAPKAKEDAA